jgi:hypothetical protein
MLSTAVFGLMAVHLLHSPVWFGARPRAGEDPCDIIILFQGLHQKHYWKFNEVRTASFSPEAERPANPDAFAYRLSEKDCRTRRLKYI